MTAVAAPSRNPRPGSGDPFSDALKARMFLAVACFWPIFVLALFAASAPQLEQVRANPRELLDKNSQINQDMRFSLRKALDRVDIMGYGPTHPRVAVVIVGDDNEKIISSVESLFRRTSLERIFLVCIVVEGRETDPILLEKLEKIDNGAVPHWHGSRADIHPPGETDTEDQEDHGSRIQVLFNEEAGGISESRSDAVAFIHMLSQKHEKTGLKSPQEDLLLLLLQSGAQFNENNNWLAPVTGALIVPPPLVGSSNNKHASFGAMKLANAVAFNTEGSGKTSSFDLTFTPITSDASATDINLSDGESYPTPVWNGGAIAMRLNTYRNLPAQDTSLTEEWSANLELSLNLWLCADGMDMIRDVEITSTPMPRIPLEPELTARFAAAWMDDVTSARVFHEYSKHFHELTHLEFETLMSKARGSPDFPIDLTERCRSFSWYSRHVNTDITDDMDTAGAELQKETQELLESARSAAEVAKKAATAEAFRKIEEAKVLQKAADALAAKQKAEAEAAAALKAQQIADEAKKAADAAAEEAKKSADAAEKPSDEETATEKAAEEEEVAIPDVAHGEDKEPATEKAAEEAAKPADEEEVAIPDLAHGEEPATEKAAAKAAKPVDEEEEEVAIPAMAHGEEPATEKAADEEEEEVAIPAMAHGEEPRKPAQPLRPFNLETVQKPKPIDITYVDVTGGHEEHPHLGAKDEEGNLGYIHDETALRLNPPSFPFTGDDLMKECKKRDRTYMMLSEKVRLDMEGHKAAEASGKKRDKIFCLAYTIEKFHDRIPAIRETWGPKCDGFMIGSTKTDKSLGTVEIPHEGEEAYGNIWQKVRSMWSYIYDNYYDDYDWFHIGGDDLFLIVENLRLYLESDEIRAAANGGIYLPNGDEKMQTPLFLGRRFALSGNMNDIFISGGSGYTMNKASLKLLVTEAFPNYFPHLKTFSEDTMVAKLLRKFEIFPYDTKDDLGGERYMPFMPGNHYGYRLPKDITKSEDWYAHYSIDIKEGKDHCSEQSVAFHYVKGDDMYRLFAMMYEMCPAGTQEYHSFDFDAQQMILAH